MPLKLHIEPPLYVAKSNNANPHHGYLVDSPLRGLGQTNALSRHPFCCSTDRWLRMDSEPIFACPLPFVAFDQRRMTFLFRFCCCCCCCCRCPWWFHYYALLATTRASANDRPFIIIITNSAMKRIEAGAMFCAPNNASSWSQNGTARDSVPRPAQKRSQRPRRKKSN